MFTAEKILNLIDDLGLLSDRKTHMVNEIRVRPFEGEVAVDVIVDSQGTTEHYHLPVFDFGGDE